MSDDQRLTTEAPTWESEMLRLHRRNALTCGWREAVVCVAVALLFCLLMWR